MWSFHGNINVFEFFPLLEKLKQMIRYYEKKYASVNVTTL